VGVVDARGIVPGSGGRAPIVFGSRSFTVTVPLSILGDDDGYIDAAAIVYNESEATDCVPNQGVISTGEAEYDQHVYLPLVGRDW
jgi:hypothetical protein